MCCLQLFGVYGPVPCFGVVPPHDADRYHVDKGLVMYGELNLLPRDDIGQSVEHFTGPFELVKDAGLVPRVPVLLVMSSSIDGSSSCMSLHC
jgi:hypothetical protein